VQARPGERVALATGQDVFAVPIAEYDEDPYEHFGFPQTAASPVVAQPAILHRLPVEVSAAVCAALLVAVQLKKLRRLPVQLKAAQLEVCSIHQ
jgi:hypothetical protein